MAKEQTVYKILRLHTDNIYVAEKPQTFCSLYIVGDAALGFQIGKPTVSETPIFVFKDRDEAEQYMKGSTWNTVLTEGIALGPLKKLQHRYIMDPEIVSLHNVAKFWKDFRHGNDYTENHWSGFHTFDNCYGVKQYTPQRIVDYKGDDSRVLSFDGTCLLWKDLLLQR